MSVSYSCLIVDDEHLARTLLTTYLDKLPQLKLVSSCENAIEALTVLQREHIDILFLDIQMPDLSGLELIRSLSYKPLTIFTTAYAEHALAGYELSVIDYLLKPISFERFVQAVNKATQQLQLKAKAEQNLNATPAALPKPGQDHFFAKVDYKLVKVYYAEILYIEGLREYVSIYTADRRLIVYQAMKHLTEILPAEQFVRVHKSYIVSFSKITSLYGNTIEIGEKQIPIGKSYKADFLKWIERL